MQNSSASHLQNHFQNGRSFFLRIKYGVSSAIHAAFEYTFTNYYVLFEDKVCWSQYQLVQPLFCSIYDLKSSVKVWHCCNLAHYNPSIFSRTIRILQGEKSFVHFKNDFVSEKHCYYYNLLNSSFTSFLLLLYAVAVCCIKNTQ